MRNQPPCEPQIDRIEQMLSRLVSLDSCFPPGASYPELADLLQELCAPLGGTAERMEVPEALWQAPGVHGARVNLLYRPDLGAADAPEALIYFHTDTAPVGDGWTKVPLQVTREGDRLYGRGTADMKGTIASVLDALLRMQARGARMAFRPVLAFCTDEEGGLYPGIRYLAETRSLPEVMLNLNGSAEPRIWAGCLGSMDFVVTLQGRTAHSGEPDRGINAVEAAAPVLAAMQDLNAGLTERTTDMPPPPWADGPLRARLSVTAIHGGDKGSAIPGRCDITLNRRYLPDETPEAIRSEIEARLIAALQGTKVQSWSVEEVGHLPPVSDPDGPATRRWTLARADAFGLPEDAFQKYGSGTSSDFGWVQRAGQQHMLLGGLSRPGRNVHAADEHTTDGDLIALSRAVENFFDAEFAQSERPPSPNAGTSPAERSTNEQPTDKPPTVPAARR
ncbi:M20 family metallopeptidase [Halovulum sp. GXIMD14794]